MPAARFLRHHALLSTLVLMAGGVAGAEAGQTTGTLAGTVTARGGTIVLPGADVLVLDADGRQMSATTSSEQGRFQVAGLPVGRYSVEATLDGFTRKVVPVDVGGSRTTEVGLDLELAPIAQTVTVTRGPIASLFENQFFTTPQSIDGRTIDEVDGLQDALRLMAGVSLTPAGLSIRGGRPTQSGLLLGSSCSAAYQSA